MTAYTKIAVTVPTSVYEAVEKARAKLNKSRSAAVALALEEWLRGQSASEVDRRYVAGYLRQPEDPAEMDARLKAGAAAWGEWEPGSASRAGEPARKRPRKRR